MPRKYYRHLRDAPEFVRSVEAYHEKRRTRPLKASLESFEGDPFLLYTCLWFAWSKGVRVTFQPSGDTPRPAPGA